MLGELLLWIAAPFVCATIFFGLYRGETNYYESEDYDGNGCAH